MAGAGYKLFATGDVLTAAQVNTYLMQQTVMVFASSAARTTALSGVLAEGMVSYLQDTNTLEVYDGSAWVGATGDITGLTAGTGISISSATGPVPTVAIDTATTVDKTTAQTLTNKTLTSPVLTTPSISNIEAKGDILVGTADNTLGVITAGANGETIVADSSTSTGLRYNPQNALANPVINGGFDVWQRGTTFSNANVNTYTADRWTYGRGSNQTGQTVTRQTTSDTTNLPNIQYAGRSQRQSGNAATDNLYLMQSIESVNCIPYAGKTVTFSYYARAGANYSQTSNGLTVYFATGTGTDQSLWSGFTGQSALLNTNVTLTTTWQRFAHTFTIGATSTQFGFYFQEAPTGTASTNDWFEVTGVQIDLGTYTNTTAPTFRRSSGTIQGELAACQRYYYRQTAGSVYAWLAYGGCQNTTNGQVGLVLPVQMRVVPTALEYANVRVTDSSYAGTLTSLSLATGESSPNLADIQVVATGITGGRPLYLGANNNAAAYVAVTAEL